MRQGGTVGGIEWHRIIESEEPDFDVFFLLPDATEETLAPHRAWLEPRFLDPASNRLVMAMQSYVLRTRHRTILVDACVGNRKERRFHAPWAHRTSTRYLDELAAIGLAPGDIDFVMCTHLHADHVGWNTRLAGGRWVPTFPNARYLFARTEYEHWIAVNEGGKKYSDGCIDDSVLPVVEAGQADIVADDYAFDDEISFALTPGHTPGHVAIELASRGRARGALGRRLPHPAAMPRARLERGGLLRPRAVGRDATGVPRAPLRHRYAGDDGALPVALRGVRTGAGGGVRLGVWGVGGPSSYRPEPARRGGDAEISATHAAASNRRDLSVVLSSAAETERQRDRENRSGRGG